MESAAPVRDELTYERLVEAASHLPGLQVLDYTHDWWDGQAHAPCLVIRGGRHARLQRIVETAGECVILPFARRTAERWLAERRRPRRPELHVPDQRQPGDVIVDASVDVIRCATRTCGALLPTNYVGDCPVCGGDWVVGGLELASPEKSTSTG